MSAEEKPKPQGDQPKPQSDQPRPQETEKPPLTIKPSYRSYEDAETETKEIRRDR